MKKLIFLSILLISISVLTACSDKTESPQDRLDTYIKKWKSENFDDMYTMLSSKSTESHTHDKFVDRYKKIYKDLEVSDLKISHEKLNKDTLKKAKKTKKATIPIKVNMNTMAGPVTFDYKATLVKEEKDDDANWYIDWDAGYIFPDLKDGGKIQIDTEAPKRGEILDRHKMPLATNDTAHEIGVIPKDLDDAGSNTKEKIASLLNMSADELDKKLDADWVKPNLYVPLKKIPSSDENKLDQLLALDPVVTKDVDSRAYPYGKAAAHLVGYIGPITAEELDKQDSDTYSDGDVIGKRGLEKLYEKELKGKVGAKITIAYDDDEDDKVLAEKDPEDGKNIHTTIDGDLQKDIYDAYDGDAGASAAIDPKTGETLALVSAPAFDPNDFLFGISQDQLDQLQDDEKQPNLNRFSHTYAPGSVMKPISAIVGMNDGELDPKKGIKINGLSWSNGKGWGDYKVKRVSESDGPVDLTDALVRSDNIYFAQHAVKIGSKKFKKGLETLGFEKDIPFDYPIKHSTISSDGSFSDEVQLANSSYGQGQLQISPLHLASIYTTFLNDGNMLKPILLDSDKKKQIWQKDLITADQAKFTQKALHKVVTSTKGTAKAAKNDKVAISGKTGTAELKRSAKEKNGKENGWFVGYPTDDQDVLIAMMMEGTDKKKDSSGIVVKKVTKLLKDLHD